MSDSNFRCPCGKSYLSYPALHTHIKRKHNGTAPGDLQMPQSKTKRGRPAIIMHKSIPSHQKNTDLNILTALELAMLQVVDLYTHSCLLSKNEQPATWFPNIHSYFLSLQNNPILLSFVQFTKQFCMHYKNFLTEKIYRFMSCLMWWVEKKQEGFKIGMMEQFVGKGLKQVAEEKGIDFEQWTGEKEGKLIRIVSVAISHWLYLNGLSEQTLELAA